MFIDFCLVWDVQYICNLRSLCTEKCHKMNEIRYMHFTFTYKSCKSFGNIFKRDKIYNLCFCHNEKLKFNSYEMSLSYYEKCN